MDKYIKLYKGSFSYENRGRFYRPKRWRVLYCSNRYSLRSFMYLQVEWKTTIKLYQYDLLNTEPSHLIVLSLNSRVPQNFYVSLTIQLNNELTSNKLFMKVWQVLLTCTIQTSFSSQFCIKTNIMRKTQRKKSSALSLIQ